MDDMTVEAAATTAIYRLDVFFISSSSSSSSQSHSFLFIISLDSGQIILWKWLFLCTTLQLESLRIRDFTVAT